MSIVAMAAEPLHLSGVGGGSLFSASTTTSYFFTDAARCALYAPAQGVSNDIKFTAITNELWFHCVHYDRQTTTTGVGYIVAFINSASGNVIAGIKTGTPVGGLMVYELFVNEVKQTGYSMSTPLDSRLKWDFYVKLNGTTGQVKVYVDDSLVIDFTGNTTGGGTQIDTVRLSGRNSSTYYSYSYFSELFVDDAVSTIGKRLCTIVPNADGAGSGWSNTYTTIDEIGVNFTDYIYTNTVGATYTAEGTNLDTGFIGWEVDAVGVYAAARISSDSAVADLRLLFRVDGTNYESSDQSVPKNSSINIIKQIRSLNPSTGLAWQRSEIDASQFGVKAV